jgi:hypothetical protein
MMLIGIFILPFVITRVPAIVSHPYYRVYEEKKLMILIGGFFLINMLQGQVSTTGAF